MSKNPWEVPVTEEGRSTLEALAHEYGSENKVWELGLTLSRLAHVVKHVGSSNGAPAFEESARLGAEAVRLLRQTDDRKALARALVIASVPMIRVDHKAMLKEALKISREIGDKEEEGWTLYRMTRADGVKGVSISEALACFEEAGCKAGIATCCLSLGFQEKDLTLSDRAVQLFEELDDEHQVRVARMYAKHVRNWLKEETQGT